jgi:dienelactone hydrolase
LDWLLAQPEVDPWRVSVVGYSFGAWVGLTQAQADRRVTAVAGVGLVAWHHDLDLHQIGRQPGSEPETWQFAPDFLQSFARPKLFVSGEHDSYGPPAAIRRLVDRLVPPKEFRVLPGTDHFFWGRESEVGSLVAGFVAGL